MDILNQAESEGEARSLSISLPGALPKELNPNWQPRSEGMKYLKASAITEFKYLSFVSIIFARNRWETNAQRWEALNKAEIQVTIVITSRMKPWDSTNARAALKFAEDSLVKAQIITDDSPGHVTWQDIHWERGIEPVIKIVVTEVAALGKGRLT